MPTIQIWSEGRSALWTPNGLVTVPMTYDYLPAGDATLTRAVKNACGEQVLYAVMKRVSKRYPPRQVGLWAPASVIAAHRERVEAMRTEDHKVRLAQQRRKRQERDIKVFCEAIRQRFPGCPVDEAQMIAEHACEVGSGRVGRSRTADEPVRAAVVAHIRHEHTDYDEMLFAYTYEWMDASEREEVRRQVREKVRARIEEILRRWETPSVPSAITECS